MTRARTTWIYLRGYLYAVAIHLAGRGLLGPLAGALVVTLAAGLVWAHLTHGHTTPAITATDQRLPPAPMTATEHLHALATHDAPAVSALSEAWVPQLASAPQATADDTYLSQHRQLHDLHSAVLLTSDSYNFRKTGHWVSVAPIAFTTPDAALAWCHDHELGDHDCYAKLLTHNPAITETTAHQHP